MKSQLSELYASPELFLLQVNKKTGCGKCRRDNGSDGGDDECQRFVCWPAVTMGP